MLHAQQRAEYVGVESGGVALRGLLGHRAGPAFSARGVDGRVQTAEAGDGVLDQIADFVIMTNVGLDEGGFGAEAAKSRSSTIKAANWHCRRSAARNRC
jgi:hypothetical protein